jgi:hypothetical protein
MSPVEILLGVAFPLLVGLAATLAMGSGGVTEFWIARIAAITAALDLVGLTIWWLCKSNVMLLNATIGSVLAVCIVLILPAVLKWVDAKQLTATAKPDVSLRFVYPTLSIYQFSRHPQSFGSGRHLRRSFMARRRPRVNQESLPRASLAG